jgi:thiamine transport system substrate-binding protein
MTRTRTTRFIALGAAAALVVLAGCGGSDEPATSDESVAPDPSAEPVTLTILSHESFTPSEGIFDSFTEETGITVEIATSADAGTLLAKASLTAGNPEGDVLWGVDNTLLSRAIDDEVFEPYASPLLDQLPDDLLALVPGNEATPVDTGHVCINYDIAALDELGVEPPTSFADLAEPAYEDLLVVPSPASSSPGLAFLMATIAELGDGWTDYWAALRDNGVEVVDGWSEAYYGSFTRAGGDRPLVVSYASSPPFEVLFADPPLEADAPAPTGVVTSTCFRQVEFAGVLRGTDHPEEAGKLIDFLIDTEFQSDILLTQFVDPVNPAAEIPDLYTQYAVVPETSLSLDPALIETERSGWIDEWTTIVLR